MIKTREDLNRYLAADLAANGLTRWRPWYRLRYPIIHWQRRLRRLEYLVNAKGRNPIKVFSAKASGFFYRQHSIRLGFTISPNCFGPGLSIAHWGTLVVNGMARIGSNCRIHPTSSIGEKDGFAPVIGDNCYIGPGARIFGGITLGDNVTVGSNAVVNRSFAHGATLVGVPARDISKRPHVEP